MDPQGSGVLGLRYSAGLRFGILGVYGLGFRILGVGSGLRA